ncbi:uncharacterized protein LOC129762544 [Toxorhynchites rutilus septentrionalis]|uniref:uncharacterized protein LOC129762544 n=1 Tax=Toxorhynchites rutilus septentrionalis TaxID=329112 RepID=UPI002479AA15|nr:uncharacterized protein LOC129762544 [Toxorhynchites rutilus septentrionalis]
METMILCSALLLAFGSHISHAVFTEQDDSQRFESIQDTQEAHSRHIDNEGLTHTDETQPRMQRRSMSWTQQVANYAAIAAVGSVNQKNLQPPVRNDTEEESVQLSDEEKVAPMKKPMKGQSSKPIHFPHTGKPNRKPSGHKKPHPKPTGDKHKHRRKPTASPTKFITVVVPHSSQNDWYAPQHLSLMHNDVSFDGPEVHFTKASGPHGASTFNEATPQMPQFADSWHEPQHLPIMNGGVPMDTPEVQQVKAAHLSALAAASGSRTRYYMPRWYRQMY